MGSRDHRNNLPSPLAAPVLHWRARQITDPVARLKFLRQASAVAALSRRKHNAVGVAALVVVIAGISTLPIIPSLKSMAAKTQPAPGVLAASIPHQPMGAPNPDAIPDVWQVEGRDGYEVYSNGLRIESSGTVSESPRRYLPLDRKHPEEWEGFIQTHTNWRTDPAGIVFHTTESDILPFERSQANNINRLAKNVVAYIRQKRAYHFLVDRYGRVFRAVAEDSIANHAGWSVWADRQNVYLNLNNSFLAVAFEAQSRPQDGSEQITQAQVNAGRVLTDMLRSKYKIRGENCTTHSQVSVNPDNWLIGAHTDWAINFPYAGMGLPDNYFVPVPALTVFGFSYDPAFVQVAEARLWKGLLLADEEVTRAAGKQRLKVPQYRATLNRRYKEMIAALNLK